MTCRIRKWRIEDANNLANSINNKNILGYLRDGLPYPYTKRVRRILLLPYFKQMKTPLFVYAITADKKVIGNIGVFRQGNIHYKTAELGYYISEPYWSTGIGTSAVKQICRVIFENTNIIRIFEKPFAHNIASCRILEKDGFLCEGTLRKNAVKNVQVIDMKLYLS